MRNLANYASLNSDPLLTKCLGPHDAAGSGGIKILGFSYTTFLVG